MMMLLFNLTENYSYIINKALIKRIIN